MTCDNNKDHDMTSQWFALRTATRQEARAMSGLKEKGFEVFLPVSARWRQTRSVKTRAETALFPGYLFILASPADFYTIGKTDGVHQFVRVMSASGEFEPMAFPDEAIGDLMVRQEFGEFDATRTVQTYRPKVGERVEITGGKWRGYFAEVFSLTPDKRRAYVSFEGSGAKMKLDIAHLDAA